MKNIKDLRESYNLITEKEEHDMNKLTQLVRAGLFDAKKLSALKRAMDKPADKMTAQEKRMMINLLDSLMAEVLSDKQVHRKIKQDLMMKEAVVVDTKDYLSKMDPRVKRYGYSQKEAPSVLLLKRKAIRVFPDGQKVALYYAQAIDKYVSIPYNEIGINENWAMTAIRGIRDYLTRDDSSDSNAKKEEDPIAKELKPLSREKTRLKVSTDDEIKNKPYTTGVEARRQKAERDANAAMAKGIRESFKSKLNEARALKKQNWEPDKTEGGGGYQGPTREMGGGANIMPRGYGQEIVKGPGSEVGGSAGKYFGSKIDPKAASNIDVPTFKGLRGKTYRPAKQKDQKIDDPLAKSKPAGGSVSTGSDKDMWGQSTSQDKVTSDLKKYLQKKQFERDAERTSRYSTKLAAIKQAKSGFGKETGATAGNLPKTEPVKVPEKKPSKAPAKMPGDRPDVGPTQQPASQPASKPAARPEVPGALPAAKPATKSAAKPGNRPDVGPTQQPASQPVTRARQEQKPEQVKQRASGPRNRQRLKDRKDKDRKPFALPAFDVGATALASMTPGAAKLNVSGPRREGGADAIRSRMASNERKAWQSQAAMKESVEINLDGNQFVLNNNEANKVLSLYESLNIKNKKKMIKMMNESKEQLNKIVSFAVRQ